MTALMATSTVVFVMDPIRPPEDFRKTVRSASQHRCREHEEVAGKGPGAFRRRAAPQVDEKQAGNGQAHSKGLASAELLPEHHGGQHSHDRGRGARDDAGAERGGEMKAIQREHAEKHDPEKGLEEHVEKVPGDEAPKLLPPRELRRKDGDQRRAKAQLHRKEHGDAH